MLAIRNSLQNNNMGRLKGKHITFKFSLKKKGVDYIKIYDKVDFKVKKMTRDRNITKWQKDQTTRKCLHTTQQSLKIHEVKTDRLKRTNRQIHAYSWRCQHLTLSNPKNHWTENQQGHRRTHHQQPTGSNWHMQTTPPNRTHVFFQVPMNIHPQRLTLSLKTNLNKFKRIEIIQNMFSDHSSSFKESQKSINGQISKLLETTTPQHTSKSSMDQKIFSKEEHTWNSVRIKIQDIKICGHS